MADDPRFQSIVNSPWLQLGGPLAATIAAAVAPRHAGRAAAMGLAGLRTVNDYSESRARLQESMRKEREHEADGLSFDQLVDGDAGVDAPPQGPAPEGGQAPEAFQNAQTQTLEAGQAPRVHRGALTPEEASMLKRLRRIDPHGAAKYYEGRVSHQNDEAEAIPPADLNKRLSDLNMLPGASVTGVPIRGMGGAKMGMNPPSPHYVQGHEGGKEFTNVITEGQQGPPQRIPTGEHDEPAERHPAPHFISNVENGKLMGIFVTPDGIQRKITLGTRDKGPEEMATNLRNKLAMRSVGKPTGDAQFDQQFADPKIADDLLKKLQSTNMADVMMELVKGRGGAEPVPGQ